MPGILVIADDFTGAAEIGGIAHLYGQSVKLKTNLSDADLSEDDVMVLDTNTRSLRPQEASKAIKTILGHLDLSVFNLIYKKVDSVLRGPIIPEIKAILSLADLNHAVLVSANPSKGRIIKNGKYYINGIPIDRTEFQYDPEYPSKSPYVKDLVSNTLDKSASGQHDDEDIFNKIEIPDAYSENKLKEIVNTRLTGSSLAAGGADFFTSILEHKLNLSQSSKAVYTPGGGNRHFVIGTRSLNGIRTIDKLQEQGYSCFYLPPESIEKEDVYDRFINQMVEAVEGERLIIIARPEPELSGPLVLQQITRLISRSAETLIKGCKSGDEIFIEGGETASTIIRNQNTDLRIREVLVAGVVKLELNNSGIFLIVKPGSYPWPNNFFNFIRNAGKI